LDHLLEILFVASILSILIVPSLIVNNNSAYGQELPKTDSPFLTCAPGYLPLADNHCAPLNAPIKGDCTEADTLDHGGLCPLVGEVNPINGCRNIGGQQYVVYPPNPTESQPPKANPQPTGSCFRPDLCTGEGQDIVCDINPPTEPPKPTKEDYEKIALEKICLSPDTDFNTLSRNDWRNINELITGRYAQLYLTNPGAFKWAGMAAYASDLVGTGMGTLGRSPLHDEFFFALKDGNMNLYMSIGWQHEVYLTEGLAGLERLYPQTQGVLGEIQITSWRMIDEGIKSGNTELVWLGNAGLLSYEQNVFLQQISYDPHRQTWQWVSEHPLIPTFSPIPFDSTTFVKYMKETNPGVSPDIGDPTQRWDWISNSMLPKYMQLETQNSKVGLDMTKYAADLLNVCPQ
jgi:hypothetical protein